MSDIVCFDTNVLVLGIERKAAPENEIATIRAAQLIERLEKDRATVLIPALLVAEFLVGIESEKHAELWRKRNGGKSLSPEVRAIRSERSAIAVDFQVLATALVRGARVIYSEDGDFAKLAGNGIRVLRPPIAEIQARLA